MGKWTDPSNPLYATLTPDLDTDILLIVRPGGPAPGYQLPPSYLATLLETVYDARYALIGDAYTKSQSDARYVPSSGGVASTVLIEGNIESGGEVDAYSKVVGTNTAGAYFETSPTSAGQFVLFDAGLYFSALDKGGSAPLLGFVLSNIAADMFAMAIYPGAGEVYASGAGGVVELFGLTMENGGVTKLLHINPASGVPSGPPSTGAWLYAHPSTSKLYGWPAGNVAPTLLTP